MKLEAAPAKRAKVHTVYRLADGTKVPGVTTVLNATINKPALIKWANQLGLQGYDSTSYVDATARIGTLAHCMIQAYLGGPEWDSSAYTKEEIDTAENAVLSFYEWERQTGHKMETVAIEMPVVSETFGYGGTVDWLGYIDGKLWLMDIKTSKGLFPEHEYQVSAYDRALFELGYEVAGVRLLRVGRSEDEVFDDHVLSNVQLNAGWKVFTSALDLYKNIKKYENAKKYGFKGVA